MTTTPGLVRGVGWRAMVAVMINAVIGAGILGLPSKIHALVGSWGMLAFVACAVIVGSICLCFAEVASRFTQTGGPYVYTRAAFGPVPGFVVGWLMWLTRVTAVAAIANVMISYLAHFWPSVSAGSGKVVVITIAILALSSIILAGVRQSARAAVAFTVGKLLPLALFVLLGMFAIDWDRFAAPPIAEPGAFWQAVFLLIFAYGGFEGAVVLGGESKDPRRDFPIALLVAMVFVTTIYVLIQLVCIGTLPTLATSTRPLADASLRFMGAAGATVVTLGAMVSTTGTMFSALFLGPRVLFAMAEQHQLPPVFGATHPRFRTPHVAIALTSGLALALAASGTFAYLAGLSVITRLLIYLATAWSLVVLRRRRNATPALLPVTGGVAWAALASAACVWLLTASQPRELRDTALAITAGLVLLAAASAWRRRAMPAPALTR
jgi:amino acid transporter